MTTRTYCEKGSKQFALSKANDCLKERSADARVEWALENLPSVHVLSSSFGAQSAVSLHMITRHKPDIPVILIDTGYLFPETYKFVDELKERLDLNLSVFRAPTSPAWQEARWGQRWTQGLEGIDEYNRINKVEPMDRALKELQASTWFSGLRRSQADSRKNIEFVVASGERWKVHPIADWNDRDVYHYLKQHKLPYHPLWEKGYVSIGDVHTTKSLAEAANEEETRFFGLKRECGIHEIEFGELNARESA